MKPKFSPDQDMSNVSPEDVKEAKMRAKATKAYDKKMPTKSYAKGGSVDGCAMRGKTKGRMI